MIPRKRERPKMGVREATQKVWPAHRRWVKSHYCSVPGCPYHGAVIDFAHTKTVGAGGHDAGGISLCRIHHMEQHQIGIETFAKRHGIDLEEIALEFVRTSPDKAMKESLRAAAVPHATGIYKNA